MGDFVGVDFKFAPLYWGLLVHSSPRRFSTVEIGDLPTFHVFHLVPVCCLA